ncbi:hypothetical protein [Rufibacter hautae]|uniref:Uncharacterized protein n=1 Tax=Rufibacter hautae TaxID=2595005 RepID=A0A5B6T6Q3_9BACT|nr:hypothetical protein [Rufibacter hautae]KAA3435948.1 hypothetical protein FOA19_23170 [Rufibacter hautae]
MVAILTHIETNLRITTQRDLEGRISSQEKSLFGSFHFELEGDAAVFEALPDRVREAFMDRVRQLLQSVEFEVDGRATHGH